MEFLNNLVLPGYPDHCLVLKKGMPVILLRNLNPKAGLCNGVGLIVRDVVNSRVVKVTFADGRSSEVHMIPRINLIVDETKESPLKWRGRQFPLRQAFSLTINKVQGQTLKRVAVWLELPVFTHGQLYTAISRVDNLDNIRFYVPEGKTPDTEGQIWTKNIVYNEVL